MPVQNLPLEVNSFVKGLVTEASPLTFPENASIDERNFVLNRDGSRRRRLGMSLQSPLTAVPSSPDIEGIGTKVFEWENAGGDPASTFLVVQLNNRLMFFDSNSSEEDYPVFFDSVDILQYVGITDTAVSACDMTSVDGTLVAVFEEREILLVSYDRITNSLSYDTTTLKIRDLFGIESPYNRFNLFLEDGTQIPDGFYDDLLKDEASKVRPYFITDSHIYNLRNQSWGRLREGIRIVDGGSDVNLRKDPIQSFVLAFETEYPDKFNSFRQTAPYPSNSDVVGLGLIDYAEVKGAPERFAPLELGDTPRTSGSAPKGFFIIDALRRGISRQEQHDEMVASGKGIDQGFTVLPRNQFNQDITPRGAKCVEEFAGRVWYAGFTSEVIDGDRRSPKMASYVLFSSLVKDLSDIGSCYQKNDPTFEQEADLLATDGGFIRLDGAYDITRIVNLGSSLIVLARNGVWSISGGSDTGFNAEAYIVRKLTDQGSVSANSVANLGNALMYWAENGIYSISMNQVGDYQADNISQQTIQKFYESIPTEQRKTVSGIYDKYDNKVRWLYGERELGKESKELILDLNLSSFYPSVIGVVDATTPYLLHPVLVRPFRIGTRVDNIVAGNDNVVAGADNVSVTTDINITGQRETFYVTVSSISPLTIGFSSYSDTDFVDWPEYSGGVDAEAYAITGYSPTADFQRRKQVTYITTHLLRTENGFEDVNGSLVPTGDSSCKVQVQWNWANSPNSNKWGREFEVYRYNRFYMPEDINDPYDTGFAVISTKNKLRGFGKTLSLKFTTSPKKDCRLLGWSMVIGVSTNV